MRNLVHAAAPMYQCLSLHCQNSAKMAFLLLRVPVTLFNDMQIDYCGHHQYTTALSLSMIYNDGPRIFTGFQQPVNR